VKVELSDRALRGMHRIDALRRVQADFPELAGAAARGYSRCAGAEGDAEGGAGVPFAVAARRRGS
jgi:hypothetical protein